jgi:ABC-type lipoprotein export system ATPase subunit
VISIIRTGKTTLLQILGTIDKANTIPNTDIQKNFLPCLSMVKTFDHE